MTNAYEVYYTNQIGGGGLEVYRGSRYQRGAGIGGVLKGLFKLGLPLFKKAVSSLGKHALSTGLEMGGKLANDVLRGKPIRRSIKKRAIESGNTFIHKTIKRPKQRTSKKKAVSRKTPRDIFM